MPASFFLILILAELLSLFALSKMVSLSLSRLFLRVTKSQDISTKLLFFLFLPGIIIHELSHVIASGILFVPVGDIELVPRIKDDGVQMGAVSIGKTDPLRRFVIGFAPVLFGLLMLFGVFFSFQETVFIPEAWEYILSLFIVFEITNTMFSSKKDMEGAVVVGAIATLFILALFILGVQIPDYLLNVLNNNSSIELLKKLSIMLFIPLFINAGVVLASKFLSKR